VPRARPSCGVVPAPAALRPATIGHPRSRRELPSGSSEWTSTAATPFGGTPTRQRGGVETGTPLASKSGARDRRPARRAGTCTTSAGRPRKRDASRCRARPTRPSTTTSVPRCGPRRGHYGAPPAIGRCGARVVGPISSPATVAVAVRVHCRVANRSGPHRAGMSAPRSRRVGSALIAKRASTHAIGT
jgi:hypothetical protein